jgi:hypothetical protein
MKEKDLLKLPRLETDEQLDAAIKYLDVYLFKNDMENPKMLKLTDLIWEYEERTDILNR